MSLLPKIPCRKLFCDSRFAEGTASEFTVEIPEGGLDLGDNTVAFVDQISVPSIQNVVDGRNTIYYEETIPVIPNLSGDWTWTDPISGESALRTFVADPADRKHWTYAAPDGTQDVYLRAFDNGVPSMSIENRGQTYEWNISGGHLLSTSGKTWTPFSFSFPDRASDSHLLSVELEPKQYSQADLVAEIQSALNSNPSRTLTSTYDVSYDLTGSYVKFKLSSSVAGESARVLTDTELRERSYHPPYIDLSGSDWQFPVFDLTGTWTKGDNEYVVRADGRGYRFSPAIYEWDQFYVVGKTVYPVTRNGSVVGYQWGIYEQTASSSTITWGPGGPNTWTRAGPHPSSGTRAVTITPRFAVTRNDYEVDFSSYLPPYGTLSFSSPNVKTKRFKQTNVTATGSTLLFDDGSTGTFYIATEISRIDLSGGIWNGMTYTTFRAPLVYVASPLPSDFNPRHPGSMNGILNNESGLSEPFTGTTTMQRTTELSHEDESIYLHMVPSSNNTLSTMTGSRSIIRRIPLKEPYPMQNHSQLSGQEYDFLNMSRMNLRRLQFSLRFADGTLVPARGHTSFSILFAVIE